MPPNLLDLIYPSFPAALPVSKSTRFDLSIISCGITMGCLYDEPKQKNSCRLSRMSSQDSCWRLRWLKTKLTLTGERRDTETVMRRSAGAFWKSR
jgi:hypothetical protein